MTKNKKAALELSMTTIVVLVLAMSMLILGLVLVKTIFSGAKYNVEQMNQKVEDEIGKLFTEDKKIVVYLANNLAEITQGDNWGVAFGIKNQVRNVQEGSKFKYTIEFDSSSKIGTSNRDCVKESEAMSWIRLGKEGSITLAPGQDKVWLVRFEIPETAPLCLIRYNIEIKADGTFYTSESFDVSIEA
jgi:hypothetical protein